MNHVVRGQGSVRLDEADQKELADVERMIAFLRDELGGMVLRRDDVVARSFVQCTEPTVSNVRSCGQWSPVGQLIYLQAHRPTWTISYGKDWSETEGRFRCPHCGAVNRLSGRPEVTRLKRFFQSVVPEYDAAG